jgi:hypothetical protein
MGYIKRITSDLLEKNLDSRDDMMLTVQYVHDYEMAMFSISKEQYYSALFSGRLSSIKTIDRIWRKVQEDRPDLRGNEWLERQVQAGNISAGAMRANGELRLFE